VLEGAHLVLGRDRHGLMPQRQKRKPRHAGGVSV
jgi:hypothetical protein